MSTMPSRRGVTALLLLGALTLSACGDDEKKPTPPDPEPLVYSELLFFNDQHTLKAADTSGNELEEVAAAAIPGQTGTYAREGNTVTVTMPSHYLGTGIQIELVFTAGTGGTATSGTYPVTVVDDHTFTITDPASGTITDGAVLRRFVTTLTGTYTQVGTTVTVTIAAHGLSHYDALKVDFTSGAGVDGTFMVDAATADTFTLFAEAEAETSGDVTVSFGHNYGIFGIAMHPSGKWIYTTSTYECWNGSPFCWGAGLVSRFGIDWTGELTFEESFTAGRPRTTPVGLTFSDDGALLFVQDDQLDGVDMWAVDAATGDLELLASSAQSSTSLHGLAVNADATRVYNGAIVFSVDTTAGEEALTMINDGGGGNSCFIVGEELFSLGAWSVDTWSLATPDAPTSIATTSTSDLNQAREMVVAADGALVVTAGFGGLKVFAYDGGAFNEPAAAGATEYIDGLEAWDTSVVVQKLFRSVTMNAAGSLLAAGYFTHDDDSNTRGGQPPSGVMLFTLAPDGSLAKVGDHAGGTYVRAARFAQKP